MQGITPQQIDQLENSLRLIEAEIKLAEVEHEAWNARGVAERQFHSWLVDITLPVEVPRRPLERYVEAQKAWYDAESQRKQVEIAKLKSQRDINRAMIQEAQQAVKLAGRGNVQLT